MHMEQWWNETDVGKPIYSERSLSQCQTVHLKSHMDWPGIDSGPLRWEAGDKPPEQWHGHICQWTINWEKMWKEAAVACLVTGPRTGWPKNRGSIAAWSKRPLFSPECQEGAGPWNEADCSSLSSTGLRMRGAILPFILAPSWLYVIAVDFKLLYRHLCGGTVENDYRS